MIERLRLKKQPDENLVMEFLVEAKSNHADAVLVRATEYAMSVRLKEQRDNGFFGWNTPQCENSDLLDRLKKNLEKGDYIDVINLAAMILAREKMFVEEHYSKVKGLH